MDNLSQDPFQTQSTQSSVPPQRSYQQQQQSTQQQNPEGLSYETKTIIVVMLLLLFYPLGLIMMFSWMKWRMWIKLLIAIPVTLIILLIFASAVLFAVNPAGQMSKARDSVRLSDANSIYQSLNQYYIDNDGKYPANLSVLVPEYLAETPKDPGKYEYQYTLSFSGKDFTFCYSLETEADSKICFSKEGP